jgi:hypothetical protein
MSHDMHWILVAFACLAAGKAIAHIVCKEGRR